MKQQRLIKKLLRSKRDSSNDLLESTNLLTCNTANTSPQTQGNIEAEEHAINDSDSAITLEDSAGLVEVESSLTNLGSTLRNKNDPTSQVPVVLVNPQQPSGTCHNEHSKVSRKSKESPGNARAKIRTEF